VPTAALCARWQHSYHTLHRAPDLATRDMLARARGCYLDELERRDPGGVARWLASETRPASTGPHRHLSADPAPDGPDGAPGRSSAGTGP